MRLTKAAVEAVQSSSTDRFVWDEKLAGFGLKVTPKGRRSYVVQYRPKGSAQARRVTLGVHGAPWTPRSRVTSEQARVAAEKLLLRVRNGEDPVEADRLARAAAETVRAAAEGAAARADLHRFEVVLDDYIERYARPKNRRWADTRRVIAHDALPFWKDRPIASITRRDVTELIDSVDRRSPATARLLYAHLRRMFGWCAERMYVDQSPCVGMRAPVGVASRDRWLSDDEVSLFWRAVELAGGPFGSLLKLLLLTGQRREEVTSMRWAELDLDRTEWIIPRERSKNDAAHAVDLAPAAVTILQALPHAGEYVFTTTGTTPMSGLSKVRDRVAAEMQRLLDDNAPAPRETIAYWRLHDLRRTAATGMAALGHPPHVIEAVLNHRSGARGGLVAVYQHYHYRPERKLALIDWSRRVEDLVHGAD